MSSKRYQFPSPRNHPHKTFITRQSSVAVVRGREKSLLTSQYQILPQTPSAAAEAAAAAAAAAAANGAPPPQHTASKFVYASPSSHTMQQQYLQKRLPRPTLPVWNALCVHDKLPYPMQVFECEFSTRTKIGCSQMPKLVPVDFDLSDPYNVHCSDVLYYNPLYDPHLAHYYRRPNQLEKFKSIGQATEAGHVACTLKQYNEWRSRMYQQYLHYVRALRRQWRIWNNIYLLKNARKNFRALRQRAGEDVAEVVEKKKLNFSDDAENLDNIAEHLDYLDKPKDLNEFLPENYFLNNRTRVGGRRASLATRSKMRSFVEAEKLLLKARVGVAQEYEMTVHTHKAKVEVDRFRDRLHWTRARERRRRRMEQVARHRHDAVDERIERLWIENEQARRKNAKQWMTNHIEFQQTYAKDQKAAALLLKNHSAAKTEAHERESRENYSNWRSSMNDVKARIEEESSSPRFGKKSAKKTTKKSEKPTVEAFPLSADVHNATAGDGTATESTYFASAAGSASASSAVRAKAAIEENSAVSTVDGKASAVAGSQNNNKRAKRFTTMKKVKHQIGKSLASLSCLTEQPKPVKKRPAKRHSTRPPNARDLEHNDFVSLPTPTSSAIAVVNEEQQKRIQQQLQAKAKAAKEPPRLKTKGGISLATITKGRGQLIHQTNTRMSEEQQQQHQQQQQHHHVQLQPFKPIEKHHLPPLVMPGVIVAGIKHPIDDTHKHSKQRKKSVVDNDAAVTQTAAGALELPKSTADMTTRLSYAPGSDNESSAAGASQQQQQHQSTESFIHESSSQITQRKLRIPALSVTAIGLQPDSKAESLTTMTPEQAELYRQLQRVVVVAAEEEQNKSDVATDATNAAANVQQRKKSRKSFVLPKFPAEIGADDSAAAGSLSNTQHMDKSVEQLQHSRARVPTLSVTAFNDAGQYEKQYNKLLAEVVSSSSALQANAASSAAEPEDRSLNAASSMELTRDQIRARQRSKKSFVMLDDNSRARLLAAAAANGDDIGNVSGSAANDEANQALPSSAPSSVEALLSDQRRQTKHRAPTLHLITYDADADNTEYEREYNQILASTTTLDITSETSLARMHKAYIEQQQAKSNKSSLFGFSHQQSTALIAAENASFNNVYEAVSKSTSRIVSNNDSRQALGAEESEAPKPRAKKKSFILPKTSKILAAESAQQKATAGSGIDELAVRLTDEVLSTIHLADVDANQTNLPYTPSPNISAAAAARKTESDPSVSARPKPERIKRFSLPVSAVAGTAAEITTVRRRDDDVDAASPADDDRLTPPTIAAPVANLTDSAAFLAAASSAQRKSRTKSEIGTAFERFSLPAAGATTLSPSDDRRAKSIVSPPPAHVLTKQRHTIVGSLKLTVDSDDGNSSSRKSADDSLTIQHVAVEDSVVRRRGSEYEYDGGESSNETSATQDKKKERPVSAQADHNEKPPPPHSVQPSSKAKAPPTAAEDVEIVPKSDTESEFAQHTNSSDADAITPTATPTSARKSRAKRRSRASGEFDGITPRQNPPAASPSENSSDPESFPANNVDANHHHQTSARATSRAAQRSRASGESVVADDEIQRQSADNAVQEIVTTTADTDTKQQVGELKTPVIQAPPPQASNAAKQSRRPPESPPSSAHQTGRLPAPALLADSSAKTSNLFATSVEAKTSTDATITLSQRPSNSERNSDSEVYFVRRTGLNVPTKASQTSTASDKVISSTKTADESLSNANIETPKRRSEPIGSSRGEKATKATMLVSTTIKQEAKPNQQPGESAVVGNNNLPSAAIVTATTPLREAPRMAWGAATEPSAAGNIPVSSTVDVPTSDKSRRESRSRPPAATENKGQKSDKLLAGSASSRPATSPSQPSKPSTKASPHDAAENRDSIKRDAEAVAVFSRPSLTTVNKRRHSASPAATRHSRSSSRNSIRLAPSEHSELFIKPPEEKRRKTLSSSTLREIHGEFSYTDALGIQGDDDLMADEKEMTSPSALNQNDVPTSVSAVRDPASRQQRRPQAPLGQYRAEGEASGKSTDGNSSNVNVGANRVADAENDDDAEGIDISLPYKSNLE